MTRRRLVYAALAAALLAPLLAGCGVPSSSKPVVVGAAAPKGSSSEQVPITKQGPDRTIDAQELVRRYLRSVAWGNETIVDQQATEREANFAKNFLTPGAAKDWKPLPDIIVVHARLNFPVTTAKGIQVEASMQQVGVLDSKGFIVPRQTQTPIPPTYQFTVLPASDGSGLRIDNPFPALLLSDDALTSLYEPWPVYFWDTDNRTLVPDLRYVSRAQTTANRDFELSSWLSLGPSPDLTQAVNGVPDAIKQSDRPVRDGNRLRINLTRNAANVQTQLPNYVVQLRWTLRWFSGTGGPGDRPVDLEIEGQHQNLSTRDVLGTNLAALQNGQGDPPRFCVVDGRVRPLSSDATALPVLSNDANAGVVSAAIIHGSAQQTALVRQDSPGKVRLWLGAQQQDNTRYQQTDLVASSTSRPVGLAGPVAQVLIAADGELYDVPFDTRRKTDVTPQRIGRVADVSVAPDGRRVALVADGVPYVGVLQTSDGSAVSVAQLRPLPAGLVDATAIAWSREEYVVVAGSSGGQSALVEATFDGALITPLQLRNLPHPPITQVVAHPVIRPSDPPEGQRGLMMLAANGHSYNVYSESVVDLATDSAFASPSPAPGKQPPSIAAPFFLD
jgi:hypothetical protein